MTKLGQFWKWFVRQVTYRQRIECMLSDIQRRVLRLEIERAIKREDVKTVYELGDVYAAYGFNSYMSEMIADFKKHHPIKAKRAK